MVHVWLSVFKDNKDNKNVVGVKKNIIKNYPEIELTSPFPILVMSSARLGSNKYQFCVALV